jgi:hypothetical protein
MQMARFVHVSARRTRLALAPLLPLVLLAPLPLPLRLVLAVAETARPAVALVHLTRTLRSTLEVMHIILYCTLYLSFTFETPGVEVLL